MLAFLHHVPWWVLPLFGYLLVQGLKQMQARRVSLRRVVLLPLVMLAWSLARKFGGEAWEPQLLASLLGIALGLAVSLLAGVPRGLAYDGATREVWVPGSPWPLILMMAVFALRFALGVLQARAPALAAAPEFLVGSRLVLGLFGGIFLARLVAVLLLVGRAGPRSSLAT